MVISARDVEQTAILTLEGLDRLLQTLTRRGFRVVGPTLRDQAIVYDDIGSIEDLPRGWTDVQEAGHYRVMRRDDDALFGYAVGPQSWKKYLHEPHLRLWQATRAQEGIHVLAQPSPQDRLALIGVRACERRAIAIQDRVLLDDAYRDPHYEARRRDAFVIAVNCGKAGGTCFCASMNAGPKVEDGFDLALTELVGAREHIFLIETGSPEGRAILDETPHRAATLEDIEAAKAVIDRTAASMGREMNAEDVPRLLADNLEHPRWDDVASRCLTCANCTMVCPTCFCTSVEDTSDLTGENAERWRRWDSCFTMDYSYIHGGSVRASAKARYRQWMTHKLSSWVDQFDMSGCVGCGRCITWCPVGIDITQEVHAIAASPVKVEGSS